jgi:hypothetical protein
MKLPIQVAPIIRQAGLGPSNSSFWTGLRLASQPEVTCLFGIMCTPPDGNSNQCPSGHPYCCGDGMTCCDTAAHCPGH